jgi:hypothetical protein
MIIVSLSAAKGKRFGENEKKTGAVQQAARESTLFAVPYASLHSPPLTPRKPSARPCSAPRT